MTPKFATAVATHLFERRWWFLGMSAVGIAVVFTAFSLAPPRVAVIAGALAGPLIVAPWALLCACVWFHPQNGNLQPGSRFVGRLPQFIQVGVRWYAAVFLGLFVIFGVLFWPVLTVAWL
jgi:hypothetical protein